MVAAVLGMILLTVWVLRPSADKGAATAPSTPAHPSSTGGSATTTHSTPSTKSSGRSSDSTTGTSQSHAPVVPRCTPAALKVAAAVNQSSYHVGDKPIVFLQVTNVGSAPCVQNLADSQVELRVYNGESRVWGSHDCTVQAGVSDNTLAVRRAVRVRVVWSGLSSQPKCAGTRQRVGAGTYTLYALLAGHEGTAAQFSIS
jgi:hypothetical protein